MGLHAIYSGTRAPPLSALQSLFAKEPSNAPQHRYLALQIAHNLRFQHNWTELHIHMLSGSSGRDFCLISGVPPERLYVHPDEQIDLLQKQKNEGKSGMPQMAAEREWVMPSHLRERWSLRRFGETFDAVSIVPSPADGTIVDFDAQSKSPTHQDVDNPWRTSKRFLLATLDDDSTVVYYIVHDGLVKPRQN
ncbi:hypothetical protein AMS68_001109 [Peltaster fructicola]|uniref:tRNA-splicing endonuclease subunit Sen15 domain-containing protein n=1 Tax=Peltaster fructicola TaxID=286661 RepID=A0A6H0XLG4_9PEZI|nr:hypothetical protein AMS68_001109 [Peltaster fructicola]